MFGLQTGKPANSSLNQKRMGSAALTFFSGQARELGKQAVNLFVWPVVVNGLGMQTYGMWVLINQVISYVQLSDLRVSSVLGLLLARERSSGDNERKQRLIGAHLKISAFITAVIALVGVGVVIAAPSLFRIAAEDVRIFRIAMSMAVVGVMAASFLSVPSMALYSQNLAYRGFPYALGFDLLGPVLSAGVVLAGLGLVGLSSATLLVAILTAAVLLVVAQRCLPWLGVLRPKAKDIKEMLGNGLRYQLDGLAWMLSENSAAIILASLYGMKEVAMYAVTERLLRISQIVANRLCNAAAPVVGEFAGAGDQTALRQAWSMMSGANNALAVGAFLVVMPLNTLFLDLLLGPGRHGGWLLSILLGAKVLVISRSSPPAYFMNQMLLLRAKNKWSLVWIISLALSALLLVPRFGLLGMAGAMLFSSFVMQQGYTWQVLHALGYGVKDFLCNEISLLALSVGAGALLCGAIKHFQPHGLTAGLLATVLLSVFAAIYVWWLILRREQREYFFGIARRYVRVSRVFK